MENKKIGELQTLESNLQSFLAQRQSIQMEINEIENALEELKDYKDEIFKMVSGMLIKTKKEKIISELKEKKEITEKKVEAIEKQEKILEKGAAELKKEIYNHSAEVRKK